MTWQTLFVLKNLIIATEILFLYGRYTRACLHAQATIPIGDGWFHELDTTFKPLAVGVQRHIPQPTAVAGMKSLGHDLPIKNRLALTVSNHPPTTTPNQFWAGTNLYWAAYIWYWRIDIIFHGGHMHWRHNHLFLIQRDN